MKFVRSGDAVSAIRAKDLNFLNMFIRCDEGSDPQIYMVVRKANQAASKMIISLSRGVAFEMKDFSSCPIQRIDIEEVSWKPRPTIG